MDNIDRKRSAASKKPQSNRTPKRKRSRDSSETSQSQPGPSGGKRPFDDSATDDPGTNMHSKKRIIDPTFPASGVKRALHGTIYQLQLLMLFVQRGIKNHRDFRLATEMDAAEKFDDVVFKYKESAASGIWTWDFLQAKHKQDPERNKITVNDVITETEGDFSLQKYFISFCKIKRNPRFQGADFKDFTICTNTGFDFSKKLKHNVDDIPTKTVQQHNERIDKLVRFFKKEEDIQGDKILGLEGQEVKEVRFKSDDETITAIVQEIKSALLKSALKAKEIENISSAKEKLEAVKVFDLKDLIEQTNQAVKNIENEYRSERRKGEVLANARIVLQIKGKILGVKKYTFLKMAVDELDKTSANDKKDLNKNKKLEEGIKKVLEEAEKISKQANDALNKAKAKLDKYKNSNSERAKALIGDIGKLKSIEGDLKKIKDKISVPETTLEEIQIEIEKEILKERIPRKTLGEIQKKTGSDLEEVKEILGKAIEKTISEISVIEVVLQSEKLESTLKEFLRKFRFVVNYPDVDQLNSFIGKEVREDFNLLNADLATHSFQRNMLDWFKEKGGRFLSKKDGNGFFSSIKEKIDILMTSGMGKAYPEKVSAYGIHFKENIGALKDFLSSKNRQVFHVSTQATRLSTIKVLESLKGFDKYKNHDSYIFMRLRTLLRQETQKYATDAFSSEKTHDLLVVECQHKTQEAGVEIGKLYVKLSAALNKSQKKIILIAQREDILAGKFNIPYENKIEDQTSFEDLDPKSQDKVLKRKVNFQGKDVRLNEILDKNLAGKSIDHASLLRLLEGEKIVIGDETAFFSIGYVKDYYIERVLHRQRVNTDVLKKKTRSELMFVTGASKKNLADLGVEKKDIHTWKDGQTYSKGIILPLSSQSDGNNKHIFQKLGKKVHWLEYRDRNLFWRASKGNSSALDKYIDKYYVPGENDVPDGKKILEEKAFSKPDPTEKFVIVANDSGMGKSTVLTSIARKIKESSTALWVVRVNLNDYAVDEKEPQSLHNINFQENETEKAIEFISKMAVPGDPDKKDSTNINFQRNLFKSVLEKPKDVSDQKPNIVILFDGFDEISPNYKANTTKLIQAFKGSKVIQLWVTTRDHEKAHLEKELESPAYILNPLTETEQKNFLSRFWKWNLKFSKDSYGQEVNERTYEGILEQLREIKFFTNQLAEDVSNILKDYPLEADGELEELREAIDELDFSDYAMGLLDQWNESISAGSKKFTLVPLHLRMLTEVVFEKKFQLPKDLGLIDLYDKFIEIKFDIFHREKAKVIKGNLAADALKISLKTLRKVHHNLALMLFLPKEESLPGLDKMEEFTYDSREEGKKAEEELARIGLLALKGGQLEFIHRSFAEYFLSEYLVRNLKNEQVQNLLLEKILAEKDYKLIRQFFSNQLEKSPTSIKLTEAVKKSIAKDLEKSYHKETLLHLMANEGHCGIYEFLFKSIHDNAELLEELMTKTHSQGLTALHSAIWGDHYKIVKQLLYNGLKLDPEIFKNYMLKIKGGEGTSLLLAAERGHNKLVQFILNFVRDHLGKEFLGEFVLETDYYGQTALFIATDKGYTKTVKTLLNFVKKHLGEDIFKELVLKANKSNRGNKAETQTALHRAAKKGYIEIVNEILDGIKKYPETFKELMLKTDYYGATVLLEAVDKDERYSFFDDENGKRGIVSALLQDFNNPEAIEDLAILSAYGDARREPKEIIDKLLGFIEIDSEIHKKLTSIQNGLGEVKKKGESLYEAINLKNKDKVQEILNESQSYLKELVLTNVHIRTPLINAADMGQSEIVEKLLESVKSYPRILEEILLKVDTFEAETALHRAARDNHNGNQTILKLLSFVKDYLGKQSLKKVLLKPKGDSSGTSAIVGANYRNYDKNVKVILEFVEEHIPEILERQVEEIGGMQETLKWVERKNYLDLKQRLLGRIDLLEQRQLALFKAAKDGHSTALKTLLDGVRNDVQALKKLLTASNNYGNTLLDLAPCDTACTLLNWVKENLKENSPHTTLKKLVLASGRKISVDTIFLNWVRDNLEKIYPGTLKKILIKPFCNGQTALSLAVWNCHGHTAKVLLNWIKDNSDEETLNDLVLATDNNERNVLHSTVFDSDLVDKSSIVKDLLKALKDHPKILRALALKTDSCKKTALELAIEKPFFRPATRSVVDLLRAQYDAIASSLLSSETSIADFTNDQLHLLEKHVKSNDYTKKDKEEILEKINAALNSKPQSAISFA